MKSYYPLPLRPSHKAVVFKWDPDTQEVYKLSSGIGGILEFLFTFICPKIKYMKLY